MGLLKDAITLVVQPRSPKEKATGRNRDPAREVGWVRQNEENNARKTTMDRFYRMKPGSGSAIRIGSRLIRIGFYHDCSYKVRTRLRNMALLKIITIRDNAQGVLTCLHNLLRGYGREFAWIVNPEPSAMGAIGFYYGFP